MAEEKGCRFPTAAQFPRARAALPPISTVPGLGGLEPVDDNPQPMRSNVLKETDSAYVRLSKLGGHKDLLSMESMDAIEKKEAVSYPRNPWFYYLDNAKEDAAKKEALKYHTPDYADCKNFEPKEAMYGADYNLPQNGFGTKNIKVSGVEIPTHGIRRVKPEYATPLLKIQRKQSKGNVANAKVFGTLAAEEGTARMDKLLANSYQREWQDQVRIYRGRSFPHSTISLNASSEYKQSFGPAMAIAKREESRRAGVASRWRLPAKKRGMGLNPLSTTAGSKGALAGKKQEERFIMNKFKQVGPKVDSRR